ncbi:hypothetical protein MMB17_15490 [Methylobacterium organophilum]|uniref:hypothetical protein n=1 Tax=Methylobacterium organophilum TaxID=410 RepID=UPI001F13D3A6|nr:hypothetical protein [Methylobacterium organophilum]UMY16119.1 hypothetical protein MMB17_15490 [Methylobacterium organophilum]
MTTVSKPPHETLDAQVAAYWEREAARLDILAAQASFAWMIRSYARKAERARKVAAQARGREAARGRGPAEGETAEGA